MTTPDSSAAKRGIRLLALGFILFGLWDLISNLLLSWSAFDPSYLQDFFAHQMSKPLTAVFLGFTVWILANPLAARMVK